jgi:hypothetical protein
LDPVTATKFLSSTAAGAKWLKEVRDTIKADRRVRAAVVLHDAAVVVNACRALDAAFRDLVAEIDTLQPQWGDKRRRKLSLRIQHLADHEDLLGPLNLHLEALRQRETQGSWNSLFRPTERGNIIVVKIVKLGTDVHNLLARTEMTPFSSSEQLTTLLSGVLYAKDDAWVEETKRTAHEALLVLKRSTLREGETYFGALAGDLAEKYALPPYPTIIA